MVVLSILHDGTTRTGSLPSADISGTVVPEAATEDPRISLGIYERLL